MSKAVAEKILKVMQTVEYLKKDGSVAFGNTNYNYLSEEKITSSIREALIENNLILYPVKMERLHGTDDYTEIAVTYRIVDVDTGDSIEVQTIGGGQDKGDKKVYKAMTGAFKYAQRETFMISTGDDPDKTSSDELAEKNGKSTNKTTEQPSKPSGDPTKHNTTKQNPPKGAIICEGCDQAIEKSGSHTPEKIEAFSKERYGKPLCKACQKEEEKRIGAKK